MSKIRVLNIALILFFITGILGSGWLVWKEFMQAHTCPYLVGIPACLIILVCFTIPMSVHIRGKYNVIYFIFTGLAATIALIASVLQWTGNGECPKINGETPMCYYSLLLFSGLIVLKIIIWEQKKLKESQGNMF
jgi:hypothetical protein